jgi:uncharacterized XkdX family phage protein
MDWYSTISRYYKLGYYDNDPESPKYVGLFVKAGKITPAQYTQITGTSYIAPFGA